MFDFTVFIKRRNLINAWISNYVDNLSLKSNRVDSLKYILLNDSKKIRAIFVLLFGEIFKITNENLKNYCLSIEIIHSYTLIHDDLPSLDNAELRRGKLSFHKVYSEAEAILLGDGLQALAFELLSQKSDHFSSDAQLKVINKFAEIFGLIKGVVYGQLLDIRQSKYNNTKVTQEIILEIHKYKTAIFFGLSCMISAVLSDQQDNIINDCWQFGLEFGLLFQFLDDIDDFNKKNEVINICNIIGYESARKKYKEDLDSFLKINKFQQFNDIIRKILNINNQ